MAEQYVTLPDGSVWPSPGARAAEIDWQLRYRDPESVRLVAASYVSAYRELVGLPAGRRGEVIRQLRDAAGMRPAPRWPLGPGEDDVEVWVPPSSDCMEHRPDIPCWHCQGITWHCRTNRCGTCGRRPGAVPHPTEED